MIAFRCAACQKPLSVPDQLAGKQVKCPGCGKVVAVPQAAATPAGLAGPRSGGLTQDRTLPPGAPAGAEARTLPPKGPGEAGKESLSDALGRTAPGGGRPGEATRSLPADGPSRELYDFLAPAQQPDEIGRLGDYRVFKVLGAGGMGVVFLAEDTRLKRKVALKAMLPALAASETARQRFLREAQTAAAIEHDHIVAIHQVGEDRGVPFIAMPFLKGEPLDERLKRDKALPVAEVLRIGRETAKGLAAAHAAGLVHRDIKPANLWLESSGEPGASATGGRVKILDFGLARAAADGAQLTQQGAIIGTPAYMAPEQAAGKPVDGRCDLFSLGCVLYRLATGQLPFKGTDTVSTLMAVATENPRPPAELRPALPRGLSDLVMQLLAKKPDQRPRSAKVVAEALQAIAEKAAGETIRVVPKTPPGRGGASPGSRARRRWPWLAGAGGVLAVAVVVVLVAFKKEPAAGEKEPDQNAPSDTRAGRLVPGSFFARSGPPRAQLLSDGGGNEQSEAAVALGLQWIVQNQRADGSWAFGGYDLDYGTYDADDIAGTALAVLPLLGAGHTPREGKLARQVERGLDYLVRKQKADGDFGGGMYVQGLATIAVCEAFGMTGDERLKAPAQQAVSYLVRAQHKGGGWRYRPGEPGDTSSTGWQFMALKTGEMAGLVVPRETLERVAAYLDSAMGPDGGYGYQGPGNSPGTTAIGLLCRQYMGWGPTRPEMRNGIEILKKDLPAANLNNVYYYYYATQVMHHAGGKSWELWNSRMRDWLLQRQDKGQEDAKRERPLRGSWSPVGDVHGKPGGRLMVTSLALLTLEVYYRHVPLFPAKEAGEAGRTVRAPSPTFTNRLGMEFVLVPRGTAWLGGGSGSPGDKEVEVPHDFYLGKYEVTQEEWEKVTGKTPSHFRAVPGVSREDVQRFPVEQVSWRDAQLFLKRLNAREKEAGWVYRLPTEVEWEYACRGGPMADRAESAFDFYLEKPTNQLLPGQANFGLAKGARQPCKVGSYAPNRLGLYDMHGNVWEWCDDAEPNARGRTPRRGGGWKHGPEYSRAAYHMTHLASDRVSDNGLRVARVPVGKEPIRAVGEKAKNPATTPAERQQPRHQLFLDIARKGDVELLFLGDSITQAWEGRPAWKKYFEPLKAANFGITGDQTGHVLWRITEGGELVGIHPRAVVLMIGTNNSGRDSAEQIAEGIGLIVQTIRAKLPKTKVLLLGIFPRGEQAGTPLREKLAAVNRLLAGLDDGGRTVKYMDIGDRFLAKDGSLSREIMPDFLHLSDRGYETWAEAILPTLHQWLK
jgi:serine/threonine protein kinase/formylglycine-generating enzyme required for sulfatase activity/lysophospholipase L1-like esterase